MEAIGYPASWQTTCFVNQNCHARCFGHTNGRGDFVLFDSLGWPWPVHDCYLRRSEFANRPSTASINDISASRVLPAPQFRRPWLDTREVEPTDFRGQRNFTVLGTVTDTHSGVNLSRRFPTPGERAEARSRLAERNDAIEIVDGRDGNVFTAVIDLSDLSDLDVQIHDIVAAHLRIVTLRDRGIFAVTRLRIFRGDSEH